MSTDINIVVIGAGPAGVRAAQTIVEAGLRPIVLDENSRWGGQIYRQPPADGGFKRTKRTLYGFEAGKADSLHSAMAAIIPHVDYRPNTVAWSCGNGQIDILSDGRVGRVPYSHLIIASGATDRVLPVPGWTLPGVYTLGGSQVALKTQGCAIGNRVVLAGTGPLLYLVAYQYAAAGAQVVAVLDTSPFLRQVASGPRLLSQPATLAKGVYYLAWLLAHGVRVEWNVSLDAIEGAKWVTAVRWRFNGQPRVPENLQTVECDAVGLGFGLRPETQLADLAACDFNFDTLYQCWLPTLEAGGRSSVPGIYLAGDGATIAGADAAELAGRRVGLSLIEDLGIPFAKKTSGPTIAALDRGMRRISIFRSGIEKAFAPPNHAVAGWPDDMILCRCEEIQVGTVRTCVRRGDAEEINRLKALTRVGMGRCQGRMCGEAAAILLSAETGKSTKDVGRLRAQAPIKPIPISVALQSQLSGSPAGDDRDE